MSGSVVGRDDIDVHGVVANFLLGLFLRWMVGIEPALVLLPVELPMRRWMLLVRNRLRLRLRLVEQRAASRRGVIRIVVERVQRRQPSRRLLRRQRHRRAGEPVGLRSSAGAAGTGGEALLLERQRQSGRASRALLLRVDAGGPAAIHRIYYIEDRRCLWEGRHLGLKKKKKKKSTQNTKKTQNGARPGEWDDDGIPNRNVCFGGFL